MNSQSEGTSDPQEENSSASSLSVFADIGRQHHFHKSGESSPRTSMDEALKSEAAFIDFVMSLPEDIHCPEEVVTPPTSPFRRGGTTKGQMTSTSKVGLDHLDNLCKLMEQLGELRDNNNKLQKRVQYLEDLRTLHDMHKELRQGMEPPPPAKEDDDPPPPFRLQKSSTETRCGPPRGGGGPPSRTPSKHRRSTSSSGRRERSKSVGHREGDDPKSRSIFKWSRVKEALGWESERKDSIKVKECYRQSLRRCSDESKSSARRGCEAESPLPHSSTEEVHALIQKCATGSWRQGTSQKRLSLLEPAMVNLHKQKLTPSPGSDRVRSYRQPIDLKSKSSTIERDSYSDKARFDPKDESKRVKSPWGRVKTIIERRRDSLKRRPLRREPHEEPLEPLENHPEDMDRGHCKDVEGTPSSSPPFHRKSRWTRVKKALRGRREGEGSSQSTPASPGEASRDGNFNFDALEEMSQDSSDGPRPEPPTRVGSEGQVHILAMPNTALMLQLERNLSDNFHRKILEWERIKKKNAHQQQQQQDSSGGGGSSKAAAAKPKLKDLAWLDKELRKIEKEKQRLSKERSKYEERAFRLEKLRETVVSARSSTKKEVLVRTSAGEFRFEGISDAFTKKLYEWETKRGVGPELSTIALLDSSCQPRQSQPKLSRSESSLAEVGQHSHNSSNSLPSLKPHEDPDRLNQHSRANSEPDLSTLVAFANGANMEGSLVSLGCAEEVCKSEAEEEDEADEAEGRKRKDSEKYYGLLEENVILLDQLKDKEELCRRLEKELETLDEKVEDMSAKHTQQMERYREKLWEMHKPGTSPTAVQGCLATMAQLRNRIETLERCTEKLRNDRESIEDSFRYHSKQQETMTLDLLEKMRELQAAGNSADATDTQEVEKQRSRSNLDSSAVERLQDLSALLVKQTEELEATLSAKTRQICELRWELLHRDLSTVRLQTELHTQTAHAKRGKYAHFRSLSSEEASSRHAAAAVATQNALNETLVGCSEKDLFTNNEGGLRATDLSNTVHQLNRELLRLSSVNDNANEEKVESDWKDESAFIEETPSQRTDSDIKVRRSSAENVTARRADKTQPSSSAEDSSEEESFTRISFCPSKRNDSSATMVLVRNREERLLTRNQDERLLVRNQEERLLMSPGEQRPGSRIQRRKRVSRTSSGRKRFNVEPLPQKCSSFRETREKMPEDLRNISSDSKLNVRANECDPKTNSLTGLTAKIDGGHEVIEWPSANERRLKSDRETVLDSTEHGLERLKSDKQRREISRREHLQRKRSKRWMKSATVRSDDTACENGADGSGSANGEAPSLSNAQRLRPDSSSTVTVLLPKRKFSADVKKDINENVVETVTLVMPRKRSLSSENDTICVAKVIERASQCCNESEGRGCQRPTEIHVKPDIETREISTQICHSDFPTNGLSEVQEWATDFANHQTSRKRKMGPSDIFTAKNDRFPAPKDASTNDVAKSQTMAQLPTVTNTPPPSESIPNCCYKSPSAPQLDWMKSCAKKTVKDGAPNVKILIEKYNQRAIGSPNTSNLNSPITPRRANIPQLSCSPPPTPSIVNSSAFYSPLVFRPTNLDLFANSPPASPASRVRAEALLRAKAKFIASPPEASPVLLKRDVRSPLGPVVERGIQADKENRADVKQRTRVNALELSTSKNPPDEDQVSMDSVSLVVLRTGANCQESRRLTRRDQQHHHQLQRGANKEEGQEYELKTSKSLSSSSLLKTMLGNDFKIPNALPGLLRLKRSRRKKDMSAVGQLCRQSLLLAEPGATAAPSAARSCPASPELKAKVEPKPGWFHRNFLRHK